MRHPAKPATARLILAAAACMLFAFALAAAEPPAAPEKAFPTPDAAWKALLAACENTDRPALKEIFGPSSGDLISSGDDVSDANATAWFAEKAKEKVALVPFPPDRMAIFVGKDEWLFPIPLVKGPQGWSYDTATGEEEIINRRIGRNELTTIGVCRAIVEAQFEFSKAHQVPHFAQKFVSTEGQHDGLYWKTKEGEPESPLGPLAAKATSEGYDKTGGGEPTPYHGYFFRILTAQGKDAPGGEKSYLDKDGKMTGGFAIVAWPANYGASGVMTFIVNQQDIVYQRDLGKDTEMTAKGMTAFNPGPNWTPVRD